MDLQTEEKEKRMPKVLTEKSKEFSSTSKTNICGGVGAFLSHCSPTTVFCLLSLGKLQTPANHLGYVYIYIFPGTPNHIRSLCGIC